MTWTYVHHWPIVSEVQWHLSKRNFIGDTPTINVTKISVKITYTKFHSNLPGFNELTICDFPFLDAAPFAPRRMRRRWPRYGLLVLHIAVGRRVLGPPPPRRPQSHPAEPPRGFNPPSWITSALDVYIHIFIYNGWTSVAQTCRYSCVRCSLGRTRPLWAAPRPAGPGPRASVAWDHILSPVSSHVRTSSANERRRYICNVFSHWLRPFSRALRPWIRDGDPGRTQRTLRSSGCRRHGNDLEMSWQSTDTHSTQGPVERKSFLIEKCDINCTDQL